jgi:uncharacterized membrane protein
LGPDTGTTPVGFIKPEQFIVSGIVIVIFIYHHHKPIDFEETNVF